jgi:hypothetical protein
MCNQFWCEIKGEFLAKLWIVSPDQELQVTEFQIVCSDQEKGCLFVLYVLFLVFKSPKSQHSLLLRSLYHWKALNK